MTEAVVQLTTTQLQSLLGALMYAAQIRGIPFSQLYSLLKLLARVSMTDQSHKIVIPSNSIAQAARHILENVWVTPLNWRIHSYTATLITDATLTRWGAVFQNENGTRTASHLFPGWIPQLGIIAVAEAAAIYYALSAFAVTQDFQYMGDNTNVLFGLVRGWSPNWYLDREINNIRAFLFHKTLLMNINYVESAKNPADPYSRGRTITPHDLARFSEARAWVEVASVATDSLLF
jgi:hypothetical protein